MKKITPIMAIFLAMLMVNHSTTALAPLAISIGDTYTFSITDAVSKQSINGTEEILEPLEMGEGTVGTITVDNIQAPDNLGFGSSDTIVNVTEEYGGTTHKAYSEVNGWSFYFIIGIFMLAFGTYGFPADYDFEPSIETNGDDEASTLPYFATSNVSYYEDVIKGENYQSKLEEEHNGDNYTISEIKSNFDTANKKFSYSVKYDILELGSYEYQDTKKYQYFKFEVEIDYIRSIVTKFFWQIKYDIRVGTASDVFEMKIGFIEGEEDKGLLGDIPFSSYLTIISSMLILSLIFRKTIKKQ